MYQPNHTFTSLFIDLLDNKEGLLPLTPQEKLFIGQLLGFAGSQDLLKQTAKQVILTTVLPQQLEFDYSSLRTLVAECVNEHSSLASATLSDLPSYSSGDSAKPFAIQNLRESIPLFQFGSLGLRTAGEKEKKENTDVELSIEEQIKELAHLALQKPLNAKQELRMLALLDNNLGGVQEIIIPPHLSDLVQHNPAVATSLMAKSTDYPQINEYYSALVNMKLSLHSMQVFNRLATSVEVPAVFLQQYIISCISACEQIGDRYMQHRFARVVSVLLQSIFRNKMSDVKVVFVEVEGFCVKFNRIRETADLFRLLKQIKKNEEVQQIEES